MDKCNYHDETVASVKEISRYIKDCAAEKAAASASMAHLIESVGELKGSMQDLSSKIHDTQIELGKNYTSWHAHTQLRAEMREMGIELRRYVVRMFSVGISVAGLLFGAIQFLLSHGG